MFARFIPRVHARTFAQRRANLNAGFGELARYPALCAVLYEPALVVERQLEFGSVIAGFEQSRVFHVYKPDGQGVGEFAELNASQRFGSGALGFVLRQLLRRNRPFNIGFLEMLAPGSEPEISLSLQRPFKLVNSHVRSVMADGSVLGESRQEWHLWRRRYNLFTSDGNEMNQFGAIDAPFLSFSFPVLNEQGKEVARIDRRWRGVGRELFTDTGCYTLEFGNLGLGERAVLLATTVSIDFDYFSRVRHASDDIVV